MSIIEKALDKLESAEQKLVSPQVPEADAAAQQSSSLPNGAQTRPADDAARPSPPVMREPVVARRVSAPTLTPDAAPVLDPQSEAVAAGPAPVAAAPAPVAPISSSRRIEIDLPRLERSGFLTPNQAQSLVAEEYRHLKRPVLRRAAVNEPDGVEDGNLVIISSSLPGEGKTYMSINLAMSIAMEVDRTVLLVDADVAKADVSRVLGVHDQPGLSSYLTGKQTDLSKLILRTNVEKLAVLPAGPHFAKLTELLASAQMNALVKELSARYPDRIVLFDSPPLLATSGASVLTHLMGQVLLVVEAVRTPKSAVKAALRQLVGVRNLSFVLNKQRRSLGNAYGGGYGYGYGGQAYGYGSRPTEG